VIVTAAGFLSGEEDELQGGNHAVRGGSEAGPGFRNAKWRIGGLFVEAVPVLNIFFSIFLAFPLRRF
jgi:hypothetical protein